MSDKNASLSTEYISRVAFRSLLEWCLHCVNTARRSDTYPERRYHKNWRAELLKILNRDAFFPFKTWPDEMRMVFWRKPIGDKDTFKLALFLLGNGCSPYLITKWILLSQCWAPHKAEKRARQLDFVLNNADQKRSSWFYHDVDYNKLLYLNGLPKQWG